MSVLKNIKIAFAVSLAVVIVFFTYGQLFMPRETDIIELKCDKFVSEWEHISENGERTPIEVPGKVAAQRGEKVTITTTLPDDIDENTVIAFRTIWQDAEVYVDGVLRTEYSTKNTRPFGKNSTFSYLFLDLEKDDAGKELTYCLTSLSKYTGTIREIYTGDKMDIMLHLFEASAPKNILAAFLLMLSFFGICVCLFLRLIYKKHLTLIYLLIAMMMCSVWMISEMEFRQLIFNNISTVSSLTYICVILIPIPFVLFINEVQNERHNKWFILPLVYNMLVFITAVVLQVLNVVDFLQILTFSHVGIGIASVCIIATIISDIKTKHIAKYKYVSIGILGLVLSTFLEIILYYLNYTTTIGTALIIGLMFLLGMSIIKTGQDLMETERKKHEAILAKEAQSSFLANMSHEIRTPINAILGMNEMVLRESSDEKITEYANSIRSSSQSLLAIINDVLDISKIESGKIEIIESKYELSSLIVDCYNMIIERVNEKGLTLHIDCNKQTPNVLYGDVSHIRQVILNLLTNAVKYTEKGDIFFRICGIVRNDQWLLSVTVEDTGIGIAKENKDKLFTKFERLDLIKNRNIEGTGLGLNIVKSLVDLMNGTVTVDSIYGTGSVFTILIPQKIVDATPVGDIDTASMISDRISHKHKFSFTAPQAKILVVDDVNANLKVFISLIKDYKMQADTALSGRECLTLTQENKYDLIFMDHMMPEMDGIETLNRIRSSDGNLNSNTPIIMLTANALIGMKEMYIEKGFTDYLSKPIIPEKLDRMIDNYIPEDKKAPVCDASPTPADPPAAPDNSPVNAQAAKEFTVQDKIRLLKEHIPDVDICSAVRFCANSEDIYAEMLKEFTDGNRYQHIADAYRDKDIKQYTIEVHTLKSTSRTVGFNKISEYAEKLQYAAEKNDTDTIDSLHGPMMTLYEETLDILRSIV